MCNACLMDAIRASVRAHPTAFEHSAAAADASRGAAANAARENLSRAKGRIVNLTHDYDEHFPTFDGEPGITMQRLSSFERDGSNVFRLTIDEHTGTHVDAPLHFSSNGASLSGLDPQQLVCPLCVISIADKARHDVNATLSADDVENWMMQHGRIPHGACVALDSGWAAKVNDPSFRNTPDGKLAFPGFNRDAADLLMSLGAAAIAVDTLSLDPGNTKEFAVHLAWLGCGRYGVECLANLDQLPATGATIFVGAPSHRGGTGGPARVLAIV